MHKKVLSAILVGALMVSTLAGCGKSEEAEVAAPKTEMTAVNVTVEDATARDIETRATYTGELITNNSAMVTSKVSAKILTIDAEVGDWVEAGDVLMTLDDSDYQYQLQQANASYAQAEAAYNSAVTGANNVDGVSEQTKIQLEQALNGATIAYNNAKTNYDRQKQLYDMGAISLAEFENVEIQLENASLQLESAQKNYDVVVNVITPGNENSAQSGVETAQAAMNAASLAAEQARTNIANTTITAPISGYIASKNVAMGQFAAAGNPLFTISNPENLEAEIKVTESVIAYVSVGGKAVVTVSSAGIKDSEATVSMINPIKDQMTGMYTVRVAVSNADKALNVGMIADVTLVTDQSVKDAISVASDAVMQENGEHFVYVVNDNKAEKRSVVCGVTDGVYTQITEGLEEGETVAVTGKEYLSENNNVVNIIKY